MTEAVAIRRQTFFAIENVTIRYETNDIVADPLITRYETNAIVTEPLITRYETNAIVTEPLITRYKTFCFFTIAPIVITRYEPDASLVAKFDERLMRGTFNNHYFL